MCGPEEEGRARVGSGPSGDCRMVLNDTTLDGVVALLLKPHLMQRFT